MRRTLVSAAAAPLLLLAACGGDEGPSVVNDTDEATATTAAPTVADTAQDTAEQTSEAGTSGSDAAAETSQGGGDAAEQTADSDSDAAAEVTENFLSALVNADPALCSIILNFDGDAPMADNDVDMEVCESTVIPGLRDLVTEEEAAIIELIEIDGADINGDTATVSGDNMSDLFAEGFGQEEITLQKFDGQWYVALRQSLRD